MRLRTRRRLAHAALVEARGAAGGLRPAERQQPGARQDGEAGRLLERGHQQGREVVEGGIAGGVRGVGEPDQEPARRQRRGPPAERKAERDQQCHDRHGPRRPEERPRLEPPLDPHQLGMDLARVRRPAGRVDREHPDHEPRERGGEPRERWRGRAVRRVARRRRAAGDHLAQHHAEAEHVGARVAGLAARLLGRHVGRGPARGRLAAEHLRQAEVEDLHLAVVAEEHVPRRHVAMDHAEGVRVGEAAAHLDRDPDRLTDRERPAREAVREARAAEELEDQEGAAIAAAHVVEVHDVGMREPRRRLGLPEQPGLAQRVDAARADRLEGDLPLELPVARLVDHPEAAAPESRGRSRSGQSPRRGRAAASSPRRPGSGRARPGARSAPGAAVGRAAVAVAAAWPGDMPDPPIAVSSLDDVGTVRGGSATGPRDRPARTRPRRLAGGSAGAGNSRSENGERRARGRGRMSVVADLDPSSALDRDACWRAHRTRDARFDGRFSRPCSRPASTAGRSARRGRRAASTAPSTRAPPRPQAAGFRPCLRCRPELAPGVAGWRGTANTVSRALALIAAGALGRGRRRGGAGRAGRRGRTAARRLFAASRRRLAGEASRRRSGCCSRSGSSPRRGCRSPRWRRRPASAACAGSTR